MVLALSGVPTETNNTVLYLDRAALAACKRAAALVEVDGVDQSPPNHCQSSQVPFSGRGVYGHENKAEQ